ncbi:helix-turn-helix domain-containing protein [Streptococcus equinus]|uniref:Putative transcriptional regulator n=1 Tax=Streptococcus equinus TaxID=1335 RepID=A0A1G9JA40_STREI|nr:helix-turn-helix transcriptional regulator [Streptococcus equinus]SDL34477.1 putative transcriptional regulator [Streptococcus equinus]
MLMNNLLVVFAQKRTNASKVSKDTGVAKSTISKIINNKTDVKLSTLIKLCNSLEVALSDLVEFLPDELKKR